MLTEVPTDPLFFGGGGNWWLHSGPLTPPIFEAKKQNRDKKIL